MRDDKERARLQLQDAIALALEAGMTEQEIKEEVDYALEVSDDA